MGNMSTARQSVITDEAKFISIQGSEWKGRLAMRLFPWAMHFQTWMAAMIGMKDKG